MLDFARTDLLGEPYRARTLALRPDDEGEVVATLVHRPAEGPSVGAVLHVHGFCDYFFHTMAADFWVERGYDFYALDLRKYGRSLLPHQTPNFARSLTEYDEELDAAYRIIAERHGSGRLVVSGHSTGGLLSALWLDSRRHHVAGVVLNSPWLDLNGSWVTRTAGTAVMDQIGARLPTWEIPRTVSGLYGRSLHRDHGGEWDFNTTWKPLESFPVYAGWLRAIRRGHAAVHRGLDVGAPALVLTSDRSVHPSEWEPAVDHSDIVLDVDLIAKWAHKLGPHVTLVKIAGALHDVVLSRPEVRAAAFAETARWLEAYVER